MQNRAYEVMTVASSGEHQTVASFNSVTGFDAGRVRILAQQSIRVRPCIGVVLSGSWKSILLRLRDLRKEGYGQSIACQACQISGSRVMIWVRAVVGIDGQAVGIEIVRLEQAQMVGEEIHAFYEVLRCARQRVSNGN